MIGSSDDKTILKTLTTTLNDSINGYRDAAEHAEGTRFRQLFLDSAEERTRVSEDLRQEVRRLGGEPDDDGSVMGTVHQRFLDLKAAITGRDDKAIINEVERGEDYLKAKFKAAIEDDSLSPQSRAVVERAYQSVLKGHDQVSQIKHSMEVQS